MPAMRKISGRSTISPHARQHATIRAPTCIISCALTKAWAAWLLTWNNLAYYQDLMAGIRQAIEEGRYAAFMEETQEEWRQGDLAPL